MQNIELSSHREGWQEIMEKNEGVREKIPDEKSNMKGIQKEK